MGKIHDWLVSVAVKKATKRGVVAILAFLASAKVQAGLSKYGLSIDSAQLAETLNVLISGAAVTALEFVRNWLKHKKGLPVP